MSQPDPVYAQPFRYPLTTRGYECDNTRTVSIPVLFSYLEQCRWDWIAHPAFGLVEAIHDGHFFVVHEQTLALRRRIGMDVPIVVRGVLERARRSLVDVRQDVVRASDGATLAVARVRGIWIGPNRKMARLPAKTQEVARFQATNQIGLDEVAIDTEPEARGGRSYFSPPPVVLDRLDVDVGPPSELPAKTLVHRIRVRPSDIDIFDHVNASTYLRYFDDARKGLPALGEDAAFPSARASLKYVAEAVVDDELEAHGWRLDEPHALGFALLRDGVPLCWARIDTRPR